MKKVLALVNALFTFILGMEGQPTFLKYYEAFGTQNIHELASGNLLVGLAKKSGTSLLDQEGNFIHTHDYAIDTLLGLGSVKKISENEFVFSGVYKYCDGAYDAFVRSPLFGTMDSMGVISSSYYYDMNGSNCYYSSVDLEFFGESGSMIFGTAIGPDCYMIKLDPFGEHQWSRTFNARTVTFVKELPNSDLIVGFNLAQGGASLARLDANGNFIWLKSYIRPFGLVTDCIVHSDSSFMVSGYTNKNGGPTNSLFMMKLNGDGEVQWCKGYHHSVEGINFRSKMVQSHDGNYVLMGGPPGVLLMKIDLSGDTIWTRQQGIPSLSYSVSDLLAHSDGGFLYIGNIDQFGGRSFLFKADSLGHLPCPDHEHIANVYVQDLFPIDSSFTLSYTEGAIRNPAYISDTIYEPIQAFDDCIVTQIPTNFAKTPHPIIRPNPNSGHFTLSFDDPLIADTFYSVYDSMGKLLYQRPLPGGAIAAEVDLARFRKGIYLLKITDPQSVRTERVVVE